MAVDVEESVATAPAQGKHGAEEDRTVAAEDEGEPLGVDDLSDRVGEPDDPTVQ
jgi:hypothetical protein